MPNTAADDSTMLSERCLAGLHYTILAGETDRLKISLATSIRKGGSVAQHGYCLGNAFEKKRLNGTDSASAF